MKYFTKKTLAIVVAIALVFTSVSVALASSDHKGTWTTKTVFSVEGEDGKWVETTKAAPKEVVRADVYMSTSFVAGTWTLVMAYDKSLVPKTSYGTVLETEYEITPKAYDSTAAIENMKNKGVITDSDIEGRGILRVQVAGAGSYKTTKYTDDKIAFTFYFTVADDADDEIGTFQTLQGAKVTRTYDNTTGVSMITYITTDVEGLEPTDVNTSITDGAFDLTISSAESTVTYQSDITFDDENGNEDSITGVIGTTISESDIPEDPTRDNYEFVGWSTSEAEDTAENKDADGKACVGGSYADMLSDTELAALKYEHEDTTLYAIWRSALNYNVVVLVPELEGNKYATDGDGNVLYTKLDDLSTEDLGAQNGDEVKAADYLADKTIPAGYEYNLEESLTVSEDATETPTLYIHLDRVKNPLKWEVEKADGTKVEIDSEDVYYGADLADFIDPTEKDVENEGVDLTYYTLGDWSDKGTTMPNETVTVTAKLTPVELTVKVDAAEGTYTGADGKVTYNDTDWTMPDESAITAPAGYTLAGFTYTAADGSEKEVTSLSAVKDAANEQNFTINEKVITFKAKYEPKTAEITFDANGGKFADGTTAKVGQTQDKAIVTPDTDPAKDGGTFKGWALTADATEAIADLGNFDYDSTARTYYAVYEMSKYEVSYKVNGEDYGTPTTGVEYGSALSGYAIPNPYAANADVTFDGWYVDSAYNTKVSDQTVTDNVVLYAKATVPVEYTVDGTVDTSLADTAPINSTYTPKAALADKTADGVTVAKFSGWDNAGDKAVTSVTTTTAKIVLTGTYENVEFAIVYTHVKEDGTKVTDKVIKGNYNDAITETAPALPADDGETTYTAWSEELPTTMGAYTGTVEGVENAKEITAVSEGKKYTVTYVADGEEKQKTEDIASGSAVPAAPADPTKDGYKFNGWLDENGKAPADYTAVTSNLTFTAQWIEIENHTDTFMYAVEDDNGVLQALSDPAPVTRTGEKGEAYNDGSVPEVSVPVGYSAESTTWTTEDGSATADGKAGTEDRTFIIKCTPNEYDVTIEYPSGISATTQVPNGGQIPNYDPELAPAEYTDADGKTWKLTGWTSTPEGVQPGGKLDLDSEIEPDADGKRPITIKPVYEEVNKQYTVTYYTDDAKTQVFSGKDVEAGEVIYDPGTPEKFGYKFVGWTSTPEGLQPGDTMPESNVEFVAQWELDKTLIAIVVGGVVIAGGVAGTVAAVNTALITGAAIVGGVAVIGGAIVLAKNTHKVTYYVDGQVYRVFYVIEGTKVLVPSDPTKSGYTFKGWDPSIPDTMPDHDLTFNAKWVAGASNATPGDGIPDTGSTTAGISALAVIASATAAAFVLTKKKKDEE